MKKISESQMGTYIAVQRAIVYGQTVKRQLDLYVSSTTHHTATGISWLTKTVINGDVEVIRVSNVLPTSHV